MTAPSPANFFSLPFEIREEIYALAAPLATPHNPYNTSPAPHPFLSANRQLRSEYLSFHFGSHIFHLRVLGRNKLAFGPLTIKNSEILFRHSLVRWRGPGLDVRNALREIMIHVDHGLVQNLVANRAPTAALPSLVHAESTPAIVGVAAGAPYHGIRRLTSASTQIRTGVFEFNSFHTEIERISGSNHAAGLPGSVPSSPTPPPFPPAVRRPAYPWLGNALRLAPNIEVLHIQVCAQDSEFCHALPTLVKDLITSDNLPNLLRVSLHVDSITWISIGGTTLMTRVTDLEWIKSESFSLATCSGCGGRHLREEVWAVKDKRRLEGAMLSEDRKASMFKICARDAKIHPSDVE